MLLYLVIAKYTRVQVSYVHSNDKESIMISSARPIGAVIQASEHQRLVKPPLRVNTEVTSIIAVRLSEHCTLVDGSISWNSVDRQVVPGLELLPHVRWQSLGCLVVWLSGQVWPSPWVVLKFAAWYPTAIPRMKTRSCCQRPGLSVEIKTGGYISF